MTVLIPILTFAWKAALIRFGVRSFADPGSDGVRRATWNAAFWAAATLVVLDVVVEVLTAIFPLALPLAWIASVGAFFLIFAGYFGLHFKRAVMLWPAIAIGTWVGAKVIPWLVGLFGG